MMPQTRSSRVSRPRGSYPRDLQEQLTLLRNAATRYDEGCEPEAKNLALRIRVLVHDGRAAGSSLLAQLAVRDRLPYLDTAPAIHPPEVITYHAGLCLISATLSPGGTSRYCAPLDDLSPDRVHPPAAFIDWWNEPVVSDSDGHHLARRDFVLWLANQDGGAHVDSQVDPTYARLAEQGLTTFQPAGELKNLALPSVRQVAHELVRTIDAQLIEYSSAPHGVAIRQPICSLSLSETVRAGRNDPCPCGSGLKTKLCFGRREPRRRISLEELLAETG